jgi:hypothetical protein
VDEIKKVNVEIYEYCTHMIDMGLSHPWFHRCNVNPKYENSCSNIHTRKLYIKHNQLSFKRNKFCEKHMDMIVHNKTMEIGVRHSPSGLITVYPPWHMDFEKYEFWESDSPCRLEQLDYSQFVEES